MACNCNNADPNCEPCAFCTPPGVVCLPDCNPEDPCPEKIDLCCVLNSGPDYPCSNIEHGQPLCELIEQFFEIEFPASECCRLEMSIDLLSQTPSTPTTTSTTSTSTTTTTTTIACKCFSISYTNLDIEAPPTVSYSYIDCATGLSVPGTIGKNVTKNICARNVTGAVLISVVDLGACTPNCVSTTTSTSSTTTSSTTTSSTTTTTTLITRCYRLANSLTSSMIVTYYDQFGNSHLRTLAPSSGYNYQCASSVVPQSGLLIANIGDCSNVNCASSTTTTTSTTSTSSTTTSSTSTTTSTTQAPGTGIVLCYTALAFDISTICSCGIGVAN